ncbi:AaceriAFL073Wp [[Ashbya] aceris (nom. inval.)]|nr:AaceriAFL073Wp [[Ashbya] aceris (nom. inval.)]
MQNTPGNLPKPTFSGTLDGPSPARTRPWEQGPVQPYATAPYAAAPLPQQTPEYSNTPVPLYGGSGAAYAGQWQQPVLYAPQPYYQPPAQAGIQHPIPLEPYQASLVGGRKPDARRGGGRQAAGRVRKASRAPYSGEKRKSYQEVSQSSTAAQGDSSEDDSDGPVETSTAVDGAVAGTSIVLSTTEDIEKWRSERRKMWLLKISNQKEKHMEELGVSEQELRCSPLVQGRKDKKFIAGIQSHVMRFTTKQNLSVGLVQRTMAAENAKILSFIKELGDANLLEHVLTEKEKEALFGKAMRAAENRKQFAGRSFPSKNDGRNRPPNRRPAGGEPNN